MGDFPAQHDELDLGRLTRSSARPSSRPSAPTRTGSSTTAASAGGWRRCSAATGRRIELAYSLMFTPAGTPVLRYGDEIGMGDDLSLPERTAPARRCSGRTSPRAVHVERPPGIAADPRGALRLFPRQRGGAALRAGIAPQLDGAHHPRMRKEVPEIGWATSPRSRTRRSRHPRPALRLRNTRCCACTTSLAEPKEITFATGLDATAEQPYRPADRPAQPRQRRRLPLRAPGGLTATAGTGWGAWTTCCGAARSETHAFCGVLRGHQLSRFEDLAVAPCSRAMITAMSDFSSLRLRGLEAGFVEGAGNSVAERRRSRRSTLWCSS